MHLVDREESVNIRIRRPPRRAGALGGGGPPQLARHHDGHAVAHGLGLLHVVRCQDGSTLLILERSTYRPPTQRGFIWFQPRSRGRVAVFVRTTSPQTLVSGEDVLTTCDVLIWGPSLMMAHPVEPPEDSQSYSRQNTTVNKKTQPRDNIRAQLSGHYL